MDILNWLYLAKNKFVRTTIASTKDLMIFGAKVGTSKRGDLYQNYAMSVEDFTTTMGGSVSTEGTSLYSTNPATSNFNTQDGVYLGVNAGRDTDNQKNVMIGYYAGDGATGVYNANFIGVNAGQNATGSNKAVFIGHRAGDTAINASHSVFLGRYAGHNTENSYESNFLGNYAGESSDNGNNSNFLGNSSGFASIDAYNCNFFGVSAGESSTGNNVNAFGTNAGLSNALNGQTIFSNGSMPTYVNHAAAALAITVLNGASANSTYLYHNQALNSIGAVRL